MTPDLAARLHDLADRIADLEPARVAGELETLKLEVIFSTAAMSTAPATKGHGDDRLLKVDEAAERLGVTEDWLRRRPDLPFVLKLSDGVVRYSSRAIDQYIAGCLRNNGLASDT